ncbi:hypothetical protein [Salirhabdus salicampi]|uniref:hypothetical protein n=1 Tax=Salirhabdus salicampi TaxID=476102 RepID=UPI0020C31556|nr:hypothetical protein [Salirhabdus salicampi]MCP8615238.1 hypothetical protein [Salirhabdus salicampi]
MNVKKLIKEFKEDLRSLKEGEHYGVEYDDFLVTLGDNGIYYVGVIDKDQCISNCESEDECMCARKYPNSFSFFSIDEVANFIVLNYFDGQVAYQNISDLK